MNKYLISILVFLSVTLGAQHFEGFESGHFYNLNWQHSGNENWLITSDPHQGNYSARAGYILNNQYSKLAISLEVVEESDIDFFWKIDSEAQTDFLAFYLDGNLQANISGNTDWEEYSQTISVGEHTFSWVYQKDDEYSVGLDTGWLDDISFPQTITFDNDIAITNFYGPNAINAGNAAVFKIELRNYGANPQTEYTLFLYREDNTLLDQFTINESLTSEENREHHLVWILPSDEPALITEVFAEVQVQLDDDLTNNISNNWSLNILEPDMLKIRIGYGNHQTQWYPFNFFFSNNISETIYFSQEIVITGLIHAISYYSNFVSNVYSAPIKVWMGNTSQTSLANGWIGANSLTAVFDDDLAFPAGNHEIVIPLDEPFQYNGNNLVIMNNRAWDTNTYSQDDLFFETINDLTHPDRTLGINANYNIYPTNPPQGYLFSRYPNISLYIEADNLGTIEGNVVANSGEEIPEVYLYITENYRYTYSSGSGNYRFGNLLADDYTVTASKKGFYSETQTAVVVENETTLLDFSLQPYGTVSISGNVVTSDDLPSGLPNAFVSLSGIRDHETVTDDEGDFLFNEVWENQTYLLEIAHYNYEIYLDTLVVAESNIDLGTIELQESAYPPENLQAVQNWDGTLVDLFWEAPSNAIRTFEYFSVYRFYDIDWNNPNAWNLIGEIADTTFCDSLWITLPSTIYQYAVITNYSNGIQSDATLSNVVEKTTETTNHNIPQRSSYLLSNHPNPFNPSTIISFSLTTESTENTEIIIYNLKGQKIRTLECFDCVNATSSQMLHSIVWDGRDDNNKLVSSGIYLYQLQINGSIKAKNRMLLLK